MDIILAHPFLYQRGGAERVVLEIAKRFNPVIYSVVYQPENTFPEFKDFDLRILKPSALEAPFFFLNNDIRRSGAVSAGLRYYSTKIKDDYDVINAQGTPSEWIRNRNERVCWFCLHEETPILRSNNGSYSLCRMKDISAGDSLFSFDASYRSVSVSVLGVRRKKAQSAKILRLKNGREVIATGDHRFFILEGGKLAVRRLDGLKAGDLIPIPKSVSPVRQEPSDLDVKGTMSSAWGAHPYWKSRLFVSFSGDSITVGNRKTIALPSKIAQSPELFRLLGYYAAEGYIHYRHSEKREDMQLGFSFGPHEADTLVKDCVGCIRRVFGAEPIVKRVQKRSEILVILPNIHALFMLALGAGSKAREKRVPNLVFNAPSELQEAFVNSYLAGDGHYYPDSRRWKCISVSADLITGLGYLFSMLGKQASIVRRRAHKFNDYRSRLKHQTYMLTISDEGYSQYAAKRDVFFVPIKEILDLDEETNVVDIEVSGNHSFLCGDGIYTHNCHSPNREAFDLYDFRMKELSLPRKALNAALLSGYKFFEFRTVPKIEKIIANSEITNARIKKYLKRQDAEIIHPGVDAKEFRNEGYGKYFLYPSRITPEKRFEYAIEAFRLFNAKKKGFRLVIAGFLPKKPREIQYLEKIKKLAEGLPVEFRADTEVKELVSLYANSYAILFCAVNEDWGLIPLESMASEKPCISVNEGGPTCSIADGETGFLVNSAQEMAEKMAHLAENPDENEKLGKEGRKRVLKNYTWDVFLDKMEKSFKEVAAMKK